MTQNVPYNLEAEQAILGCVIIDNEIIVSLSDEMTIQDFYDRTFGTLGSFACCR